MKIFNSINLRKLFSLIRKDFDKHPIIKFISVLSLIILYFLFVSRSHGLKDGFLISILTWSFFVLCTPIADAGILIDFPMRLITGMKMIYSELMVWVVAISFNLFMFFNNPNVYKQSILLSLFKHIIETPFPYWTIILLAAAGTFLSIYMADSLMDAKKTKKSNFLIKHKIIIFIFLIIFVIILYDFLLNQLSVQIPLI